MSIALIILLILFLCFVYITICKQINDNKLSEHQIREIKYLEYSIVGMNSPFNNFKRNTEFTILSYARLKNIKNTIKSIISKKVAGDILEAGNWRGGSMLYARGLLEIYGIKEKNVWMLDTFSGFPKDSILTDQIEKKLIYGSVDSLMKSNSIENVKKLFEIYNLTRGVNFIVGPFQNTIPNLSLPLLSYLRLDADSYSNTKFLLENTYMKLNVNGYIEFDDYGTYPGCKRAVDEFRRKYNIRSEINYIYENHNSYEAIYWIKQM